MSLGIIAVLLLALGASAAAGFFVLKKMVKWAVRLALLCAGLALLLAGAVAWWWWQQAGTQERRAPSRQTNRGAAARPANRSR
jgi:hypothetical protein